MPSTSVSVSIRADKAYILALKAVAAQNGLTVADIVRSSVDEKFGNQLEPHLSFFAAQSGDKSHQSETKEAAHAR